MNANELADELDKTGWTVRFTNWELLDEAATMLRQQQAEIEALKARLNPYQSITDTKIEPTVVSYTHPVNTCKHGVDDGACKECYQEVTHPAKLTDEDLMEIFYEMTALSKLHCEALTKAILRKAN